MRPLTALLFLCLCGLLDAAEAPPEVARQVGGVSIGATRTFTILSSFVREGEEPPRRSLRRIMIVVVLTNVSDASITLPTKPDHVRIIRIGESYRVTTYEYPSPRNLGSGSVESEFKFQPVTLGPGEYTELPYVMEECGDLFEEQMIPDYVIYRVDSSIAERYGWWSGEIVDLLEPKAQQNQTAQPGATDNLDGA